MNLTINKISNDGPNKKIILNNNLLELKKIDLNNLRRIKINKSFQYSSFCLININTETGEINKDGVNNINVTITINYENKKNKVIIAVADGQKNILGQLKPFTKNFLFDSLKKWENYLNNVK